MVQPYIYEALSFLFPVSLYACYGSTTHAILSTLELFITLCNLIFITQVHCGEILLIKYMLHFKLQFLRFQCILKYEDYIMLMLLYLYSNNM